MLLPSDLIIPARCGERRMTICHDVTSRSQRNRPKLARNCSLWYFLMWLQRVFFLICSNIWSTWRTLDGRAQPRRVWRRKTSRVKSINKIRFSSLASTRRLKDFPVGNRGWNQASDRSITELWSLSKAQQTSTSGSFDVDCERFSVQVLAALITLGH